MALCTLVRNRTAKQQHERVSFFMRQLSLLFTVCSTLTFTSYADAETRDPNILVLHSYSTDFTWTKDSNNGIIETLNRELPFAHLRTEFMDTKNYHTPYYTEKLADLFADKYADAQPDGIIATDNNAFTFLEHYGKLLFPKAIAIATGINNAKALPPSSYVKTVIAERVDHAATIRQALHAWPKTRNIFVISDATPSGKAIMQDVRNAASTLSDEIHVTPVPGMTLSQLEHFVSTRPQTDLIYILPFFRDIEGITYKQGEVERRLARLASTPVLASWRFQIQGGVLGGNTISGRTLGEDAVKVLLQRMRGQKTPSLMTENTSYANVYDYEAVQHFKIDTNRLPPDTIFLNRPVSLLDKYQEAILPVSSVVAILLLLSLLLHLNLQKQKRINQNNKIIMELDKEVIETQRELVTTLGEVIEVRSQETGNHVKRVAKISRMLGDKAGLTEAELIILEAASPLHDVGKIGIPESILHKPGKLTDDEFETIKSHTSIGKTILEGSNRELLKISCEIAHQHHERWDGTGYPRGLAGEEISLYARITALADIYDALSSDRCYKKAWPEDKTLAYLQNESGHTFDPMLVSIFMENLDEARTIRARYPNDTDTASHHHSSPRGEEQLFAKEIKGNT